MERILLLGSKGLIGGKVRQELETAGHKVYWVSRVGNFLRSDMKFSLSKDYYSEILAASEPTKIINAMGSIQSSLTGATRREQVGSSGTLMWAQQASEWDSEVPFIHISTSLVEPSLREAFECPTSGYITEKCRLEEKLMQCFSSSSGQLKIIRLNTVLGESRSGNRGIDILARGVQSEVQVLSQQYLRQFRDYIRLRDAALEIVKVAVAESEQVSTFLTVGTGFKTSGVEILRAVTGIRMGLPDFNLGEPYKPYFTQSGHGTEERTHEYISLEPRLNNWIQDRIKNRK